MATSTQQLVRAKTIHFGTFDVIPVDGSVLPDPQEIHVVRYEDGFLMFYLDEAEVHRGEHACDWSCSRRALQRAYNGLAKDGEQESLINGAQAKLTREDRSMLVFTTDCGEQYWIEQKVLGAVLRFTRVKGEDA